MACKRPHNTPLPSNVKELAGAFRQCRREQTPDSSPPVRGLQLQNFRVTLKQHNKVTPFGLDFERLLMFTSHLPLNRRVPFIHTFKI